MNTPRADILCTVDHHYPQPVALVLLDSHLLQLSRDSTDCHCSKQMAVAMGNFENASDIESRFDHTTKGSGGCCPGRRPAPNEHLDMDVHRIFDDSHIQR